MAAAKRGRRITQVAGFLGLLLLSMPALPQEQPQAAAASELPSHPVVLRISSAMLASLVNKEVDWLAPVNDVILGTPVTGQARIVAQSHLELKPSDDQARFKVTFTGTIASRTVGRNGPAVLYGHSKTRFTAAEEIVFVPGRGFHASQPEVQAQTECGTDAISSARGGIAGHFIRRRAWREVGERQPQIAAICRQRALGRIASAFEQHMGERIARLNRMVEMRARLAGLRPEPRGAALVCRTTPEYLEIADAGNDSSQPIVLPTLAAASEAEAPVEIWLYHTVVPQRLVAAIQQSRETPEQNAVLNFLTLLPGTLGAEAAAALAALIRDSHFSLQNIGDWIVVEIVPSSSSVARSERALRR